MVGNAKTYDTNRGADSRAGYEANGSETADSCGSVECIHTVRPAVDEIGTHYALKGVARGN